MNNTFMLDGGEVSNSPVRPWTEFVILGLGLPAAIWVASRLIKLSVPASIYGSPGERFLWWIAGPAIAEWLFVLGVVFVLRRRRLSLKDTADQPSRGSTDVQSSFLTATSPSL